LLAGSACAPNFTQRHPHRVVDGRWNRSCKYDDPDAPDTRIIHFHGRKHCRPGLPYHGAKWVSEFEALHRENVADLRHWAPAGDRILDRHLRSLNRDAMSLLPSAQPDSRATIRAAITDAVEPRLILGARKTVYEGWISTDKDTLDVRKRDDWQSLLRMNKAHRLLSEHVWEHLRVEEMDIANRLAFEFLKKGGCLRIAVPDGFHPDENYIAQVRPGGTGLSAIDHKQLLNHQTLRDSLRSAGFEVEEIEHWDRSGVFHYKPWRSEDGHIKRSAFHDRRNRRGRLNYTSLIIDAWKQ
jgi:predicted SAM-dependent methyltransferase